MMYSCFSLLLSAQWWAMFGGDTPTLQKLALRLVSQCCSSSGCERNWSTFALIHTKVRNRMSYQKLHKLVYVNYNLRIRMREAGLYRVAEEDPFHKLMELSLYDANNPIRDWMEHGRSNADPVLDEEAPDSDVPIPSHLVTEDDDPQELQRILGTSSLVSWAERNIGETHTGKRKHKAVARKAVTKRKKKTIEQDVRSDDSTDDDTSRSPTYQESNDSSSPSHSGGNVGDAAAQAPISPLRFTGTNQIYYVYNSNSSLILTIHLQVRHNSRTLLRIRIMALQNHNGS